MRKPSINRILILATAAALSLAACGGTEDTDGISAEKIEVKADTSLHEKLPPETRDRGTLVMATDTGIGPPFASYEENGGDIVGFNVDLGRMIAERLGLDLEVKDTTFDSLVPGIKAGRYDMAISVLYDTEERQRVVDFVDYVRDGTGILVSPDSDLEDLDVSDLCGLSVGTIPGSTVVEVAKKQTKKCVAQDREPVEIEILNSNAAKLLALRSGRIDVVTGDELQYRYLADTQPEYYELGGPPLDTGIDGIALQKNSRLVPLVQQALQSLMDGTDHDKSTKSPYARLLVNYSLDGRGLDKATVNLGERG